jgi:hypothetical protein
MTMVTPDEPRIEHDGSTHDGTAEKDRPQATADTPAPEPRVPAVTGRPDPPPARTAAPTDDPAVAAGPPGGRTASEPGEFRENEDTRADRFIGQHEASAFLGDPVGDRVGAAAHGWAAQATVTVVNERAPDERIYLDTVTGLTDVLDRYARTATDDLIDEIILRRDRPLAVLTGDPGTGRRTSAQVALARRRGTRRVTEITLARGSDLRSIRQVAGKPAFPVAGTGYLLVQESDAGPIPQEELEHALGRYDCSLLIIRPTGQRGSLSTDRLVRHQSPDTDRVFRKHLYVQVGQRCVGRCATCVRTCVPRFVDRCADDAAVRAALASAYGPAEAASLAVQVGRCGADATAADLRVAVERAGPGQRSRAERILLPGPAAEVFADRRDGRYERAFRLAYGVFHGQPMARVFSGARLLLVEMDRAAGCAPIGRPAFEHPVRDLLGPDMAADWTRASSVAAGTTRVARLHDPELLGHLLDVAWHDFDHTRPALIGWLRTLGRDEHIDVRRNAALTAARLARYDFEQVFHDLIEPWARSARREERQMAAAVVAGATGGEAGADAAAVIQRWARDRRAYLRDTAARAYTTGLTRIRLEWAMEDLGCIARDRIQRGSSLVAEAVAALYRPGSAGRIVAGLAGWLESPSATVPSHVARVMILLARIHDGFLADLGRSGTRLAHLVNVWHATLPYAQSEQEAWRHFCSWLTGPDTDRRTARATVLLLSRDPILSGRFDRLAEQFARPDADEAAGPVPSPTIP